MKLDSMDMENVFDNIIHQQLGAYSNCTIARVKAVMRQESAFNPVATSHVGARGLMQTMPATDKWIDNQRDGYDVAGNIRDGVLLMDYLCRYWGKRGISEDIWEFVHASYNAGQGNIQKARDICKRKGADPDNWKAVSWHLEKVTGLQNSRQTIDYVEKVIEYHKLYSGG
jgi:membrane-bound lytic murein transglycosylase F